MTWLMEILEIQLEEQFPKYCVIKNLVFLKIRNMMDIKEVLCQWFTNSLIKSSSSGIKKMRIFQTKS